MVIIVAVVCLTIGASLIAAAFISMEFSSVTAPGDIGNIASILHANDIDFEDVFIMQNPGDSVSLVNDKSAGILPEFQQYYNDTCDGKEFAQLRMER